jgi:hypothetical protein
MKSSGPAWCFKRDNGRMFVAIKCRSRYLNPALAAFRFNETSFDRALTTTIISRAHDSRRFIFPTREICFLSKE